MTFMAAMETATVGLIDMKYKNVKYRKNGLMQELSIPLKHRVTFSNPTILQMIEDARAWANRMLLPAVQKSSYPMSPSRPKPKLTVLMVNRRQKSRSPEKESEKPSNGGGRGYDRREVDNTFHPLVGHTTTGTYTSASTDPTNNFEGSTEGSAEGSGVGQDHAPDQDGVSVKLPHVGPRNRELTNSRRTGRNDGFDDDDEDKSSGVEELSGDDGDGESSDKADKIYDGIERYPGLGTSIDSDKNYRDTFEKSQTPENYDEDGYPGKDGATEEDIWSDGEEDSYEGQYPDDGDETSGSDTDEDMGSGGEDSSGEGSGQS